ncbi:hypothetical protein BDR26DRAFT_863288 [Obelidium mucronatum]|nr:hypothetical protein BDR26DRAFT_863288 [Obelidium mucronatum]
MSSPEAPSLGNYVFGSSPNAMKKDSKKKHRLSLVGASNLQTINSASGLRSDDGSVHRSTPSFVEPKKDLPPSSMLKYTFGSIKSTGTGKKTENNNGSSSVISVKYGTPKLDHQDGFHNSNNTSKKASNSINIVVPNAPRRKSGLQHMYVAGQEETSPPVPQSRRTSSKYTRPMSVMTQRGTGSELDGKDKEDVDFVTSPTTTPAQKSVVNSIWHGYLFLFLLPAFDNKGRPLTSDQFDGSDLDGISFGVHGLHPKSYFCTALDFVMSFLMFACLWIVPFIISYHLDYASILGLSMIVTTVFAIDTTISCFTPQSSNLHAMCSFREYEALRPPLQEWIVHHWLKIQLPIDFLSVIPFELYFNMDLFIERPLLRLLCLFRILRFYRLPSMISRCAIFRKMKSGMESKMGTGISKVVPLMIAIFVFIHFNACTIFFVGSLSGFVGWSTVWMEFDDADVLRFYIWSFFQAAGNLFPMSFKPQTAVEQVVECFYIVVGAVLYAVFIGSISSAAMSINPSGRLYNQKMEELVDYVKWKKLGNATKEKLISYYETKYRGKYFEEDSLLSDMNESLRTEISLHNTRALIEKVPFLRRTENDGRDEIFFNRIATVLHARYYILGDYITKQGDSGSDMFFIVSGKLNVFVNGTKVVSLYDGAYIGEVALISKVLRTATVQAAMPSVLYRLTHTDFHAPVRGKKMVREAEEGIFAKPTISRQVSN